MPEKLTCSKLIVSFPEMSQQDFVFDITSSVLAQVSTCLPAWWRDFVLMSYSCGRISKQVDVCDFVELSPQMSAVVNLHFTTPRHFGPTLRGPHLQAMLRCSRIQNRRSTSDHLPTQLRRHKIWFLSGFSWSVSASQVDCDLHGPATRQPN